VTDVLVRRLRLRAVADDAEGAVLTLRTAQDVIRAALSDAFATLGDSVLLIRHLHLQLAVTCTEARDLDDVELGAALKRALCERITRLRSKARRDEVTNNLAFFETESDAIATYLEALEAGARPGAVLAS
jgi:hypothetical protein